MASDDTTPEQAAEPTAPMLRVITPDTTPEEIAALVAVLSGLGGGTTEPEPPASLWAAPIRGMRTAPGRSLPAGRGAWRASGLPG